MLKKKPANRVYWEDLATILLLPVIIYLSTFVWSYPFIRTVSGFAYILVAPGYCLLAAVFPKMRTLDLPTRFGLSMGVSIALTTIIGLILNYTIIGISSESVLIAVTLFVVIFSGVASRRRKKIEWEKDEEVDSGAYVLFRKLPWVLGIFIVSMLIFSVSGVVTVADTTVVSDAEEPFTEFYTVKLDSGEDVRKGIYFTGEPVLFTLTVINREGVDTSYRVVVAGEEGEDQIFDFRLESGEQWRQVAVIVHNREHQNAKVSFFLYKQGVAMPYRFLYTWVTITPRE